MTGYGRRRTFLRPSLKLHNLYHYTLELMFSPPIRLVPPTWCLRLRDPIIPLILERPVGWQHVVLSTTATLELLKNHPILTPSQTSCVTMGNSSVTQVSKLSHLKKGITIPAPHSYWEKPKLKSRSIKSLHSAKKRCFLLFFFMWLILSYLPYLICLLLNIYTTYLPYII